MNRSAPLQERAIVAHILDKPEQADEILEMIDASLFETERCKTLISAMSNIRFIGDPIEISSIANQVGGDPLNLRLELQEFKLDKPKDSSISNIERLCQQIKSASSLRNRYHLLERMKQSLSEEDDNAYAKLEQEFVLSMGEDQGHMATAKVGDIAAMQALEIGQILAKGTGIAGIPTGFVAIDNLISGLVEGLHMIAALSGVGKSTLAMNMATHIAMRENLPVFAASLEMPKSQLTKRIICAESGVPFENYRIGNVSETDMAKICRVTHQLRHAPLHISDNTELSLSDIALEARRMKAQNGGNIGAIVVDYIQIANLEAAESESYAIKNFSRGLKVISGQLRCPVIGISQFTKGAIKNPSGKPTDEDMFGSGFLKNDSNTVALVHRKDKLDKTSKDAGIAQVDYTKNRDGQSGEVNLAFMEQLPAFANLEGV